MLEHVQSHLICPVLALSLPLLRLLLLLLASLGGGGLFVWTHCVSQIPLVHGGLFVGRNQHVVSHITSGCLQTQDCTFIGHCVGLLLLVLDCDSMFCVPCHYGNLCAIGNPSGWRNQPIVALAHDFYSSPLCALCAQS